MRDTCRTCDFFLDRGLASASSPPSKTSDLMIGMGICRRRAPQIVGDAPYEERSQFPMVDDSQWCGDFRSAAHQYSPC